MRLKTIKILSMAVAWILCGALAMPLVPRFQHGKRVTGIDALVFATTGPLILSVAILITTFDAINSVCIANCGSKE